MMNWTEKLLTFILRILPFLYMGFIWYLSGYPSDAVIDTGLSYDRALKEAMHLIEFAALYVLFILALITFGKLSVWKSRIAAFLAFSYGLTDEIHQYFIPSRSATVIDLVKDGIGIFVVWYLLERFYFKDSNSKIASLLDKFTKYLKPVE